MLISQYLILYGLLLTAVVVHELGHYVIARLLGIQIQGVYIFWSLGFHVFSTHDAWFVKLFPTFAKKHEICIGWIPLFAYVKFERLSDISFEPAVSLCFWCINELCICFYSLFRNIAHKAHFNAFKPSKQECNRIN